jgi:uncharacterized lipoprotein YddW (UPF0748 family)
LSVTNSRAIGLASPVSRLQASVSRSAVGSRQSAVAWWQSAVVILVLLLCCAVGVQAQERRVPVVLWCDGTANLDRLGSRDAVARVFDQCVEAGVNTVVIDVKPVSGELLYRSAVAPKMLVWRGVHVPLTYDLLQTSIEEGHKRGLAVYASINVFSEGHKYFGAGWAYQHPELQSVVYEGTETWVAAGSREYRVDAVNRRPEAGNSSTKDGWLALFEPQPAASLSLVETESCAYFVDGSPVWAKAGPTDLGLANWDSGSEAGPSETTRFVLVASGSRLDSLRGILDPGPEGGRAVIERRPVFVPISRAGSEKISCFVNPLEPEVRERELSIIAELAEWYDLDGLILDRMRYSSERADFSALSRADFELWLGEPVTGWPDDVMVIDATAPGGSLRPGPLYGKWHEWRAATIKEFLSEARGVAKSLNPDAALGVYVGSWYDDYYGVGVNWAKPGYPPASPLLPESYSLTGYADTVDLIMSGCYYYRATADDPIDPAKGSPRTVEEAARLSMKVVGGACPVLGSTYVVEFDDANTFAKAIIECLTETDGLMVFDLVHLENRAWWDVLRRAVSQGLKARNRGEKDDEAS